MHTQNIKPIHSPLAILLIALVLIIMVACNQHAGGRPGTDNRPTTAHGADSFEASNTRLDLHTLLRPTNSSVLSGIPVTTLRQASPSLSIEALGRVDYDTRRTQTIATRVSGRIEKLYVHYRYQHVHMGDRIMDIYSPELVTAQQDLLFLLHNDPGNTTLIDGAHSRLLLLGMDNRQLQQVIQSGKAAYTVTVYTAYTGHIHEAGNMDAANGKELQPNPNGSEPTGAAASMDASNPTGELPLKEGMYVRKGQTIFQLYNTDQSWIVLNLFPGHAALVKAGTPVTITPETAPSESFTTTIGYLEPFYRGGSQTLTARVYFDNRKKMLPIGGQVKATLQIQLPSATWLPREAVLSLGLHHIVLQKENGLFLVTTVQTGLVTDSLIQITGGLNPRDSVAADAQYLIDSESFIKAKK